LIFDSGIVPTMWYDFVLIFDSGIVPTVWYLILELFRQCVWFCFYIWFWNCSGSVVWICFDIWFWNCIDNVVWFCFSFYIFVSHVFVIMFLTSMTVTRENRKTFTTRLLFSCFHKLLKTFPTFYYRYRNLVYRCNSTCRYLIKKGNLPSIFYGDIINKAKQFKYDTSELVKYLKIFIRIGYNLAVRVHSLMQDYFTKNIDNLLGQTGNYISFHIILRFQYLIPTNWWCICSVLPRTPSMFLDVHD
jgi:hypothetical protein